LKPWKTVDDVLDFAIQNEEESARFYADLADRAEFATMSATFKRFAMEEQGHKAKLLKVKEGGALKPLDEKIPDFKIEEYLPDLPEDAEMDYQNALITAMKKEKAAFKLYTNLAEVVGDERLEATFSALAQEEAKHKLRFEIEYDDNVLTGN